MERIFMLLFLLAFVACSEEPQSRERPASIVASKTGSTTDTVFDPVKWKVKEGKDHPYRMQMLQDLVYNQELKGLTKEELINLLGEPERSNKGFLYYTVEQKRLGWWPLHTTSLVIELSEDSIVKKRMIHK